MATITAFSPHGEYLSYSSPDGSLKLWDTESNSLKQEYTPSSHLSATCTCLSWNSSRRQTETPKKKKRRKSQQPAEPRVDLIAMGTASGSILLYSVLRGELQTEMSGGHSDTVNDICWSAETDSLYSCSNDQHVIEWDTKKAKIKHKWKADKSSVYSLCVCPGGEALLSAGRTIKLWDLSTQTVLKTFTGHATEVFQLLYAPTEVTPSEEVSTLESLDNSYFVSAARHDKLINVWHVSSKSRDKNSIASLSLPEEPTSMQMSKPTVAGQPLLLAAVSKSGHLVIYELHLNGRRKKPIDPTITIQIATPGDVDDLPRPIPILAGFLCGDNEQNVLLCHGNFLKPTFEKLSYKSDQSEVCLIRDDPTKTKLQNSESDVSKIKTPNTSKDVTVLAPGHMAPSRPSAGEGGKKKNKRKLSSSEMSMEERIKAITIDKTVTEATGAIPKADNMAVLLSQGLQSQDKKILNSVLQNTNDKVIQTTVRRLPVPVVIPLVKELSRRLHGHAQSGHTLVKWIKCVLTIHTSYLMTFPALVDSLSSLYQMMDARTTMLGKLSKLQGKLDLVVSQITTQETEEETGVQQPMLVYQDESSDDDDALVEDMVTSHSESEDNWNVSDMELNDVESDEESADSD